MIEAREIERRIEWSFLAVVIDWRALIGCFHYFSESRTSRDHFKTVRIQRFGSRLN